MIGFDRNPMPTSCYPLSYENSLSRFKFILQLPLASLLLTLSSYFLSFFLSNFFKVDSKWNCKVMFSTGICGLFKVGLLHSKKTVFIDFNESSLKTMKNDSYFMLKALFVLDIFTFLYWLFGYVEKRLDKAAMTSQTGQQLIAIHILRNIPRNEGN